VFRRKRIKRPGGSALKEDKIYRTLQQHLDKQAIGFPSTISGADIRFLKRMFTADEAQLALLLSYKPAPEQEIVSKALSWSPSDRTKNLLQSMFSKGSIGWREKGGENHWRVMPMVIGMYEAQAGDPTKEFINDAHNYMKTMSFGKSIISVSPPQMRTIPINRSLPVEHNVATYDDIRSLINQSSGPFVVLKCICRVSKSMKGHSCASTSREETCLALNDMAAALVRRGLGREISRQEALEILEMNQEDGLVLQPANAQKPEFVCSCCGCCCGILQLHKRLPFPSEFWSTNYLACISPDNCTGCGVCVSRCQVNAIKLSSERAVVNMDRCIGCGVCVPTCPSGAIMLSRKETSAEPPENEEELNDQIMARKKSSWEQWLIMGKALLGFRQK
jgi:Na+-translocating ferredoxin:NAD+ oxidoreductase subunit B